MPVCQYREPIKNWPENERPTKRLKKTSEIIGIDMLGHIIIGDGKYYSFLDERLL